MTVTLNNTTYEVCLALNGRPTVLVQKGPSMWRLAPPETAAKILAGLWISPLRVVSATV